MDRMDNSGTSPSLVYAAPLVCVLLYWRCLDGWFQLDDFAWLGLRDLIGVNLTWAEALFSPMAQGTIRPVSERLFFIVFRTLFDLNAFPYHLLPFVTLIANLFMLGAVVRRLDPRGTAWLWATLLWGSQSAIAWPMAWAAAYNQLLCAFIFLAAILLLDRAGRTGRRRDEALHWLVFLLGFGVLEINAVYPAIAIAYCAVHQTPFPAACVRRLWLMLLVSAAYTAAHTHYAPKPDAGPYALALDGRVLKTLGLYLHCSIWPACSEAEGGMRVTWASGLTAALALLLIAGLARHLWTRHPWKSPVVFGLLWLVFAIAPYLLLPAKISLYYLTVPAIGVSIALALLIGPALECPAAACRLKASLLVVAILPLAWLNALRLSAEYTAPAKRAETLVESVEEVMAAHPGKLILLEGVDDSTFWDIVYHHPFRLVGSAHVLLTPGSEAKLRPAPPAIHEYEDYILSPAPALHSLNSGEAVVYRIEGERLRNVTAAFRGRLTMDPRALVLPRRVVVAEPWFAHLLDESWYPAEGGFRWMPRRAKARLRGPGAEGGILVVTGFCVPAQLERGSISVTASVDGAALGVVDVLSCGGAAQQLRWRLPHCLAGRAGIQVQLEVNRTDRYSGDTRDLGFAVQALEIGGQ